MNFVVYLLEGKPGEIWASGSDGELVRIKNDQFKFYSLVNRGLFHDKYVHSALVDKDTTYFISTYFTGTSSIAGPVKGGILKHYNDTIIIYDSINVPGFNESLYMDVQNSAIYDRYLIRGAFAKGDSLLMTGNATVPAAFNIRSKKMYWYDSLTFPDNFGFHSYSRDLAQNLYLCGSNASDTSFIYSFREGRFQKFFWKDTFKMKNHPSFEGMRLIEIKQAKDGLYYLRTVRNGTLPNQILMKLSSFRTGDSEPTTITSIPESNNYYLAWESNGTKWTRFNDSTLLRISPKGIERNINLRSIKPKYYINQIIVDTVTNTKWISSGLNPAGLIRIKDVVARAFVFNGETQQRQDTFTACLNNRILVKDSSFTLGEGIKTLTWTLPDNSTRTGPQFEFSLPVPGLYRIRLTAVDSNGSRGDTAVYVRITQGLTVSIIGPARIEVCKAIPLSASNSGIGQLSWITPAGDTIPQNQVTASLPGVYIALNVLGNCIIHDSVQILVPDTVRFDITQLDPTKIPPLVLTDSLASFPPTQPFLFRLTDPFNGQSPANYQPWTWNPAGNPGQNTLESYYSSPGKESGIYLIKANGTNPSTACPASASTRIIIVKPETFVLDLPNMLTTNGDAFNESFTDKTGRLPQGYTLEVFNRWGNSVFHQENYQKEWPQKDAKPGIYFFVLRSDAGKAFSGWVTVVE